MLLPEDTLQVTARVLEEAHFSKYPPGEVRRASGEHTWSYLFEGRKEDDGKIVFFTYRLGSEDEDKSGMVVLSSTYKPGERTGSIKYKSEDGKFGSVAEVILGCKPILENLSSK